MELLFAGAAGTVTGSCHMVRTGGSTVLIDCGLFQGRDEARNSERFPFDPARVDAVLLSHAHLDHVGRLPLLIRRGFRGSIHATGSTRKVAEVILRDAAKLQAEDAERAARKARRAGRRPPKPLFVEDDVDAALERFAAPVAFDTPLELDGLSVRFRPAGHILGSAWLDLERDDRRLIVSGDLGNRESALQAPAVLPGPADAVLVESTYGDRNHRSHAATLDEFAEVLRRAAERGGKVLIPSFALERSQQILYALKRLVEAGRIPPLPTYLDSPMAARMTALYRSCANEFRPEVRADLEAGDDPFAPPQFQISRSPDASRAINRLEGPAIVIAGSGMMTGGRILHHLRHQLWKPDTSLVVVGYQASGTLGRAIVGGAQRIRIFGEEVAVRASVHTIGGFSAHADQDDLLAWLGPTGDARVFLVHGEPEAAAALGRKLTARGRDVRTPALGDRAEL